MLGKLDRAASAVSLWDLGSVSVSRPEAVAAFALSHGSIWPAQVPS